LKSALADSVIRSRLQLELATFQLDVDVSLCFERVDRNVRHGLEYL
jgi:hypothetical protein